MNYIREIPFVQMRPNTAECGAACLQMVYLYHSLQIEIDDIWNHIKQIDPITKRFNCRTFNMPLHARSVGLFSVAVTCRSPLDLLDRCAQNDIIPIALYRPDDTSPYAHFSVVVGVNYKGILLHDPEKEPSQGCCRVVKVSKFVQQMRPLGTSEMTTGNTFVLVAASTIPTIPCTGQSTRSDHQVFLDLPACLIDPSIDVLSLWQDEWVSSISPIRSCHP